MRCSHGGHREHIAAAQSLCDKVKGASGKTLFYLSRAGFTALGTMPPTSALMRASRLDDIGTGTQL